MKTSSYNSIKRMIDDAQKQIQNPALRKQTYWVIRGEFTKSLVNLVKEEVEKVNEMFQNYDWSEEEQES